MQDNLIWSGNAFFTSAGDHMNDKKSNMKSSNKPETTRPVFPNKPEAVIEAEAKPVMAVIPNVGQNYTATQPAAQEETEECGYRTGDMPSCAPLAVGYVPVQRSAQPVYGNDDALTHGTLFPGLDLPFMDIVNKGNPYAGTPLGDLMAVSFVTHELTLYLDTHPKDKDAFALLKKMLKLKDEAHVRYTKMYGPITTDDLLESDTFTWVHGPWPWETPAPGTTRTNAY